MMEKISDIVREMRDRTDLDGRDMVDNFSLDAEFGERGGYDALKLIRAYADRIEAAAKREKPAISEDCKRSKYERLHECFWDKRAVQCVIRQMLDERDDLSGIDSVSANRMDYFANLLIGAASDDGKLFGNVAKTREALKYLRDASREFCHLILNSKHNEIFDKYKHAEVAKIRDAIANAGVALAASPEPVGNAAKMREVIDRCVTLITEFGNAEILKTPLDVIIDIEVILKVALAATPRNCDRFENFDKAQKSFLRETGSLVVGEEMFDWLFAKAKGETK